MAAPRPNILLIMSDQHHAGIMGCAGDTKVHTPALDRLAASGVRFSNAYCAFPLCGPSRMSFMTCRHPSDLRLWDNETELHSDIPTFAHAFLEGGYDTVLSGRMHFVGHDQRHGFAERCLGDVQESSYLSAGWKLQKVLGSLAGTTGPNVSGLLKSGPGRSGYLAYDETVTRASVDWLRNRGQNPGAKPFMMVVGYVTPHCPFVAPSEDFERYAKLIGYDDLPAAENNLHPINAHRRKKCQVDPLPPRDAQWRTRVAYYGLCSFLDRQVDAILNALRSAGLSENTVVIYTSDHGEALGEHGLWWKSTFYDGSSRVPLLMAGPGISRGAVTRNVSLMDIGSTLLDLCGIAPLPGASGRSFRKILSDNNAQWDDTVYAENVCPGLEPASRMVRSGPWKYNYYHGAAPELFNLEQDPGERTDLASRPEHLQVAQRLRELALTGWDPDYVTKCMERIARERKLIAHWVRTVQPEEPDPLWFDQYGLKSPLENWVNMERSLE
jgi:choline-sulfatase